MKYDYFSSVCLIGFLTHIYAEGSVNTGCFENEKAQILLGTAENFLSKAKLSLPSCKEDVNTGDESECSSKEPLAYIEISEKVISDLRKNFPNCSKPIEKDDKDDEKDDKDDDKDEKDKIQKLRDCSEILASGSNKSGVYTIWVGENLKNGKRLQVYCDMETDKGGWTVIQRRGKFPDQESFYKRWKSYKNGFGNIEQEFWLGNENIRILCLDGCEIRFDLQDSRGVKAFALYQKFQLLGENYRLDINYYSGTAGDSMQGLNEVDFSTMDKGNTNNAMKYKGGWWYSNDQRQISNLNGIYFPNQYGHHLVMWYSFRIIGNLGHAEIKVRPN